MNKVIASRVLGVLGLVLFLSSIVTSLFSGLTVDGQLTFTGKIAIAKVVLGIAAIAASFALGESGGLRRFFTGRAAHFGFFTATSALLVVAVLVAANFVAAKKPRTWDLTRNRIFTLADDTVRTLKALKTDVTAVAFYRQDEQAYPAAQDLLKRYADESPHFKYRLVDPYKSPEDVKRFAITEGGPRIVLLGEQGAAGNEARVKDPTEEALTNGLVKLTHATAKKVYFTEGHGEPALREETQKSLSIAVKTLEGEGAQVAELSLLEKPEVPADAAAVLVVGARKPFLDPEVQALRKYADQGGHVGVFLEPEVSSGLDAFLKEWGIEADDDMVVDPSPVSRLFGGSPVTPIVKPSARHEITKALGQTAIALPTTRSLVALTGAKVTPTPLAVTGQTAWGETNIKSLYTTGAKHDEGEKGGPLPVAMAAEKGEGEKKSRIVVVGDSEFFSNQYQQLLGNLDFFLNSVSWLAQQEDRITIRPRAREASRLFLSEAQVAAIKFFTIDALPVALLGVGLAVWLVRRSK